MRIKNFHSIFGFVVFIISFSVSIILFIENYGKQGFNYLFLLPLIYSIITFFLSSISKRLVNRLLFILLYGLYFVRMVLQPFLILLSNYSIVLGGRTQAISDFIIISNLPSAVILMCYEFVIVFFTLYLYYNNLNVKNHFSPINEDLKTTLLFKEIITSLLLFIGGVIFIYPQFTNYFEFFISNQNKVNFEYSRGLIFMKKTIPYYIYWLVLFILDLLQIYLPILIVYFIHKRIRPYSYFLAYVSSLVILFFTFVIMTPQRMTSIQLSLVLFVILNILYPKTTKQLSPFISPLIITFAIIALLIKVNFIEHSKTDSLCYLSGIMNAYFSGPFNVSASLSITHGFSFNIVASDILRNIPFLNYFFKDMPNSVNLFNKTVLGENQTYLIFPMIGQGKFYFGYIFAPLFSFISIVLALYFERKFEVSNSIIGKYIFLYISILFGLSLVMYNFNILISFLFNALFCLILLRISQIRFFAKKTID